MGNAIYIIIDWFTPAYKAGGPIQSVKHIAEHLQDEMEISIVCSNRDYDKTVLPVSTNQWVKKHNYRIYYTDRKFRGVINAVPQKSVVYINGIFSIYYNLFPLLFLKGRKIVAVRGMLDPGGLSQKPWKKRIYLLLWKWAGLHKRCEYHATSMIEKENIQATLGSKVKVWVIQNLPGTLSIKPFPYKKSGAIILCTVALVSKMKNHLLVIESLMKCQADVVYHIYGPIKDNDYWQTCSKAIEKLPVNISVTYHGIISPDHICDAIADAHVYIQPSKSENYSHSLVDAFMTGRPVITSYFTPWNNLVVEYAGVNVSIEGTTEITKAIDLFAAMDVTELQRWSKGAGKYAAEAMNTGTIKEQYVEMFTTERFN